jgi:ribosomal protein S18 acetylase RimI-like enzyme
VEYREATANDAEAIAELHAESWRRHYRGAYLDNLHVRHDLKRHGIGARLMAETVRAVARRRPSTGLYLWVLEQNTAAQAFYGAQGGSCVQRELAGPFPGGGYAFSFRYAWPDLSKLAEHD